jgi:hypothetical protein
MKSVIVYEVESDRGNYWYSLPFVPGIWEHEVEEDPWPTVRELAEKGYEVTIKSHAAYLEWLKMNEEGYFEMEEPELRHKQPPERSL